MVGLIGRSAGRGRSWYVDSNGATQFVPTPETTIYYASSINGSSANNGLTPATPKLWTGDCMNLMTNGKPDWLLVERGSVYSGSLGYTSASSNPLTGTMSANWNRSGRSSTDPMYLGPYGTGARPVFKDNGLANFGNNAFYQTAQSGGAYVAVKGFEFRADSYDPSSPTYASFRLNGTTTSSSTTVAMTNTTGISTGMLVFGSGINGASVQSIVPNTSITISSGAGFSSVTAIPLQFWYNNSISMFSPNGQATWLLFEDCYGHYAGYGTLGNGNTFLETYETPRDAEVIFRRCYSRQSKRVGLGGGHLLIADRPRGIRYLCEENVSVGCSTDQLNWDAYNTGQVQGYYVHDNHPTNTFRRNTVSEPGANGLQNRDGGPVIDNLMVRNGIAILNGTGAGHWNILTTDWNVVAHGGDINQGIRLATAAASSGTTLKVDAVKTNSWTTATFIQNLDNPGSIAGDATIPLTSRFATFISDGSGITLSTAIAAGKRGDGVQVGDRIAFLDLRGQGLDLASSNVITPRETPYTIDLGNGSSLYPPSGTVTMTIATQCVVSNSGFTYIEGAPVSYTTTGALLSPIVANTIYYVRNPTASTYNLSATPTGALIDTSASSQSGVHTRKGTVDYYFPEPLPSWVQAGMTIGSSNVSAFPSSGKTTIASIASDRLTFTTTDGNSLAVQGGNYLYGHEQNRFYVWDDSVGNTASYNPTPAVAGPNNAFVFNDSPNRDSTGATALGQQIWSQKIDGNGNTYYNWSTDPTKNVNNRQYQFYAGNQVANTGTPTINLGSQSNTYPGAHVAAYEATLRGTTFVATITPNGSNGGYLDIVSGTAPLVGDHIFDQNFAGTTPLDCKVLRQETAARYTIASTRVNISSSLGQTTMVSGSIDKFLDLALQNSEASYDTRYTAHACNEFIRGKLGMTLFGAVTYPQADQY